MQLSLMIDGESFELFPASRGQFQKNIPVVGAGLLAHNQTRGLASIAEFDCGVMAQSEPLRRIAYRHNRLVRSTSDLEEELMLLRLKAMLLSCCLTEVEKAA